MNGAVLLLLGLFGFALAYRFYGRYLDRIFEITASRPTPAHTKKDNIDYVPAKAPVLFGHHFASIAGAGPIVGPVLGACFGWVPVALWIVLGSIFIGAVHDFAALAVSIRHEGRSIGHVIETYIGYAGRQLFLFFSFAALLLVIAIFALLIAKTFVASPSVATSSVYFVALALIFGRLVYGGRISLKIGSIIFVPLLFAGIYLGIRIPLDAMSLLGLSSQAASQLWLVLLLLYSFIASVAPVWMLLQPRDYLNSYLLYGMITLGFLSIFLTAPNIHLPAFAGLVVQEPTKGNVQWALFPILYVTVACGACSGFHALVSSGTTAKQLANERHVRPIGYGAMLMEGIVAMMALISVAVLTKQNFLVALSTKGAVNTFASGLAGLSARLGLPLKTGETFMALAISAFMLTTLDTATRLTRFTFQELFLPRKNDWRQPKPYMRFLTNRFAATAVAVGLAGYLAFSGDGGKIWPVFGASNQLLAALTLLAVTVILVQKKTNFWITLVPFVFMMGMSYWALIELFRDNLKADNIALLLTTSFLLLMAAFLIILVGVQIKKKAQA